MRKYSRYYKNRNSSILDSDDLFTKITVFIVFLILSTIMYLINIPYPSLPPFIVVELSSIPIIFITLFNGYKAGILLSVLKNILVLIIKEQFLNNNNYMVLLVVLFIEVVYVVSFQILLIFVSIIHSKSNIHISRRRMAVGAILASFLSSVISSLVSLPFYNYIAFPTFIKYWESKNNTINFLDYYHTFNPKIDNVFHGLLFCNFPVCFVKLFFSSLVAITIYYIYLKRALVPIEKLND